MNSEAAQERIISLSNDIHNYNQLYYVENKSVISDYEFDLLLKELQDLEKRFPELQQVNSPTQRVGGDISKKFNTVTHQYPMLSLGNTYAEEEIVEWVNRIQKSISDPIEFVCELKYDGVAIGIRYEQGILTRALTRGDGQAGEEVTQNVKTIRSIPLKLQGDFPPDFEIRGEVFMPLTQFEKLNKERDELGEQRFANPRNTASGTLKMLDSKVVASRNLDSYLYGLYGTDTSDTGHYETVLHAAQWGFKTPLPEERFIAKVNAVSEIMDFIDFWDKKREDLPFEIDGIVIKVNDYQQQKALGFTAKSPRWAISFKFKTKRVETELLSLSYQVGRTGAITPVANLNAVQLGGTTVRRASLYNADQIEKLDLHLGDFVYVEKGGEIIPKIVGVNFEKRKNDSEAIVFITHCPECNSELKRREGEVHHYCLNESSCPTQVMGKMQHFISRKALNIDGLGEETISLLFENKLVSNCADIYTLSREKLLLLDRMAEKSVDNLLFSIEQSKAISFDRVLFGLGIRFVGETVAKKLAKHFKSMEKISIATFDELIEVDEIGEKIAISVQQYFQDSSNLLLIDRLMEYGLQFTMPDELLLSSIFIGKTLVVSGTFLAFSREELKQLIEKNGGKLGSSVSSKTDYLVAGANMGPAKLKTANDNGVVILSEDDFIKMISL
jgi:DNA ligase (NAD+)